MRKWRPILPRADPQYSNSINYGATANESSDTRILVRVAPFDLQSIYRCGYAYKKAGVMLTGIALAAMRQASALPLHGNTEKLEWLMQALDKLNQIYGRNIVSVFSASTKSRGPCTGQTCRPAILKRRAGRTCTLE